MMNVMVLLDCYDINTLEIKSAIFIPRVDDVVDVCKVCGKRQVKILQVGKPFEKKENEIKPVNR